MDPGSLATRSFMIVVATLMGWMWEMVRRVLPLMGTFGLVLAFALPGLAAARTDARSVPVAGSGVHLYVKGGDGLVLTRKGGTAHLRVGAEADGKPVPVPGALRYASSAPGSVSVSGKGVVTALALPGSAVITVTSTAAGVGAASVTVAAAELTSGTANLAPSEVVSVSRGRLVLVRDRSTLALTDGSLVVDAPAGLVARLSGVVDDGRSVMARTSRVPLTRAFRQLHVRLSATATAATIRVRGRHAVVTDAAGQVIARAVAVKFKCTTLSGTVTVSAPSATLTVTGRLTATISVAPRGRLGVMLQAGAAVSGSLSLGALRFTAPGGYDAVCSLSDLPGLSVPLPEGLPPVAGNLAVTAAPSFTAFLTGSASGTARITAPVVTDTWSAMAGISYTTAAGWSPVHSQTTATPQVTGPELAASAASSVSLKVAARLDLGVAADSDGTDLASASLSWAELAGMVQAGLASPVSDLDFGYTGPTYTASAEQRLGLDITAKDAALTEMLSWIGLKPPAYNITLLDRKFPPVTQPAPTITSADSALTAGQTTDTLTSSAGTAWNGTTVNFVLFPATTPGRQAGIQVATATVTSGVATATWRPSPRTTPGNYVLVAELTPAGYLPFPSPSSSPITITPASTWGSAIEIPGITALDAGGGVTLTAVSCPSAGNCTADGTYDEDTTNRLPFVVSEKDGTWSDPIEVPGISALETGDRAALTSLSCGSAGNCLAGGYYLDSSFRQQSFVVSETDGTWGDAIEVPGTAALNTGQYGGLGVTAASCSSAGNCSAAGQYQDSSHRGQDFVVSETDGTWGGAIEVPGLAALNTGGLAVLESVSCASAGNCSAGGYYSSASERGGAFVVSETDGSWGDAIEVPGLAAIDTGPGGLLARVTSVSCASAGNCSAGGFFEDSSNAQQAFIVNETDGIWRDAVEVPGTAVLNTGGTGELVSVSCASPGNCSAGGDYRDSSYRLQDFVVSETRGTWGSAIEVPGLAALSIDGYAALDSLSCASAGNCSAGGYYWNSSGVSQAFVVSETNGLWGSAIDIPGLAALNTSADADAGAVDSVSCVPGGDCTAGGSSGADRVFVVSSG